MAEFRMPSLGADMDFGRVVEWLVRPGDRVERGQIIVEIETDKGTFEVESPSAGLVGDLVVAAGSKVRVGTVLATIGDGAAPPTPVAAPTAVPGLVAPQPPRPTVAAPATPTAGPRVRISPLARRMAESLGIDPTALHGTGAGGAITKADVEAAASGRPAAVRTPSTRPEAARPVVAPGAPTEADPARIAMRRAIAAAVSRSKREIPHYYLETDVDLTAALGWLERRNAERPVADRVLPAVLLIKAVAKALRQFPDLNGFWTDGGFRPSAAINVGVAIALRGGGLVAPAIHDTDVKSVDELMTALRDVVARARSGGLRGSEMTDATATVTSLGDEGASTVFGVIYPPQVAIIGFGRIAERAWAENGMLAARRVVTVTLAADHRATDGHYGGLFLAELGRLLHAPDSL
jgi:pyruvate dehydrogenase E2 component (dihydrolipoyllysine-residue acetyltransferase)